MRKENNNRNIIASLIEEMENDIRILSNNKYLCSSEAEPIAVQHNLSGSIEDGKKHLKELIKKYKNKTILDNKDVQELTEKNNRLAHYKETVSNDPISIAIYEAYAEDNQRALDVLRTKKEKLKAELHKKKECVCFLVKGNYDTNI